MTERSSKTTEHQPPHAAARAPPLSPASPRARARSPDFRLCPVGGAGDAALSRHRGEPSRRTSPRRSRKIPASRSNTSGDHRRCHQARHHPAELVRPCSTPNISRSRTSCRRAIYRHGCQEDQDVRQYHPGLHQGRIAERQEDRQPGHRAMEGALSRRQAFEEVLEDADRMADPDPDHLQRRHARHPAGPHQAADQRTGRSCSTPSSRARPRLSTSPRSASWMPRWWSRPWASIKYADKGNMTRPRST